MSFAAVTATGYRCERCDAFHEAASPFEADKPNGYFIKIERVTGERNRYHNRSDELFLCDKDCLIDFFQYGISGATMPWTPIGPVTK